jgi:hypothetical protein
MHRERGRSGKSGGLHSGEDASMKRERDPYVRGSRLKHSTESTLRHLAEMYGQNELKQAAEVARENARRCLEAADAKAAEKRVRKEQRASTAAGRAYAAPGRP